MEKNLKGTAWKFGDNINADVAIQFYKNINIDLSDTNALAKTCMIGIDPDFPNKAKKGDFIVAGRNFGSGHIHANFYYSIKALGISAVIAESFNHRVDREMINGGVLIMISPNTKGIKNGERISVDTEKGIIMNADSKEIGQCEVLSPFITEIIDEGGIEKFIKNKLRKDR